MSGVFFFFFILEKVSNSLLRDVQPNKCEFILAAVYIIYHRSVPVLFSGTVLNVQGGNLYTRIYDTLRLLYV